MKRAIELKHIGPRDQVKTLINELIDRLELKLHHFRDDSLSVHVLFVENGSGPLYRPSLTCHVPHHMVATHEESRNAGVSIRKAFSELERQIEKRTGRLRSKQQSRRRAAREAAVDIEPVEPM